MTRIIRRYLHSRKRVDRSAALRLAWMTDSHAWSVVDNDPEAPGAVLQSRYFFTVGDKIEHFVEQVNIDQPHGVIHTGDLVEKGRDFDFFRSKWDGLDPLLPQAITPGNHDFAFVPPAGETLHDTVALDMGYSGKTAHAGSKFNQAYVFTGNGVTIRLLMLDTNILPSGEHQASNTGYLSEATKTWIQDEIAASPQDLIFMGSHHGPHMYDWSRNPSETYFDEDDAMDLRDIVAAEKAARPARKITSLFGHHHIQNTVMTWSNLDGLPGLLCPATVELNPASYLYLLVAPDGQVGWEMRDVRYPHP